MDHSLAARALSQTQLRSHAHGLSKATSWRGASPDVPALVPNEVEV